MEEADLTVDQSILDIQTKKPTTKNKQMRGKGKILPTGIKPNPFPSLRRSQIKNNVLNALLAVTSIMLVYYESEAFYTEETKEESGETVITKNSNESNLTINFMRGINIILTVLIRKSYSVYLTYRHYQFELKKKIARKQVPQHGTV